MESLKEYPKRFCGVLLCEALSSSAFFFNVLHFRIAVYVPCPNKAKKQLKGNSKYQEKGKGERLKKAINLAALPLRAKAEKCITILLK